VKPPHSLEQGITVAVTGPFFIANPERRRAERCISRAWGRQYVMVDAGWYRAAPMSSSGAVIRRQGRWVSAGDDHFASAKASPGFDAPDWGV